MTETTQEERDELRRIVPITLGERHCFIAEAALDDADRLGEIERQVTNIANRLACDRDYSKGQGIEDLRAIIDAPDAVRDG